MFGIDDAAYLLAASGIASTAGSLYTNSKNLEYQQNVNDTNWQIAAQNNATQIEMANTAHQREVADLKAAGLNPILSSGGSGASTPSLTSAKGDSAQIENPVNGVANSAKDLARYVSEQYKIGLEQADADVENTKVSTDATKANIESIKLDAANSRLQNEILRNQRNISELDAEKAHIESRALNDLTTTVSQEFDKSTGRYHYFVNGDDIDSEYYKAIKEGLLEEAKVKANAQLWQAIDSGSKVINSASSLKGAFAPARAGRLRK